MTNRAHDDPIHFAGGRRFACVLAGPPWQFVNRTGKMARGHRRPSRSQSLPTLWKALAPALVAALLSAACPTSSRADGALAVGVPADVARLGLSMGWVINYPTREDAHVAALQRCRDFKDAPQATRDLCKVIESFRDRCVAIALDPQPGTPGVGWAVAVNQQAAESNAMARCAATAGRDRQDLCRITDTRCDGQR